jgi:hypothetical protein
MRTAWIGVTLSFLTLQFIPILFTSLAKPKIFCLASMKSFNVVSIAAAARTILPLKESSMAKVVSCPIVTSNNLDRVLDDTKDVTRGVGSPSVKMAASRPAMGFGRLTPSRSIDPLLCVMRTQVLVGMDCDLKVHFPLVQWLESSIAQSRPCAQQWGSSHRRRWSSSAIWWCTSAAVMMTSHWCGMTLGLTSTPVVIGSSTLKSWHSWWIHPT